MELEAKKRDIPFLTAMASLKSKWDLYVEEEDYIELAYPIWRSIGNIATDNHSFSVTVPIDGVIQIPVGCEFIKSVSTTTFKSSNGESNSAYNTRHNSGGEYSEVTPDKSSLSHTSAAKQSEDYTNGERVNWTNEGDVIRITSPNMVNQKVSIIYKGIAVDTDGLPLLNDKELEAVLYNVAVILAERDLFRKVPGAVDLVKYLKPEANRTLAAAKIPEKITDDALDKALDIKTSRDFKRFGIKFDL